MKWWKHAFAVESPGPVTPSDLQRDVVEKLCRELVRRRMTTPAVLMLEMSRPLNYVSAQFLHFAQPLLVLVADAAEYKAFAEFLEQRGSIDYICGRLTDIDAGRHGKA